MLRSPGAPAPPAPAPEAALVYLDRATEYLLRFLRGFTNDDFPETLAVEGPAGQHCVHGHLKACNALDVSGFHHRRVNHSRLLADHQNHINGIESFWNQAKRLLHRFNGIKKENFYWLLKEYEWRFNGGSHQTLLKQLKYWYKSSKH